MCREGVPGRGDSKAGRQSPAGGLEQRRAKTIGNEVKEVALRLWMPRCHTMVVQPITTHLAASNTTLSLNFCRVRV
jgi:hypothetical protein